MTAVIRHINIVKMLNHPPLAGKLVGTFKKQKNKDIWQRKLK